jgi:teichuronic acid biosynthesis glycosyltransferase TuaH
VTSALTRRYLRRATARLGGRVRAILSAWPQYPVFGSCGEQVRAYWVQDDYVGGAALLGLNAAVLDRRERQVAAGADLVVAASPVIADTWRSRGLDPLLVPNGADVDTYREVENAPRPADVSLPGPVAGFVGHINGRIDLRLLEDIADLGRSLLLVGPKDPAFEPGRFDALRLRPNVRWVGPKPFDALPGYLRVIDVGVVPYRDSPFNRGSFPLKTLEYLAAGRAVVATDLPAIRWLATDLVCIAAGPEAFAGEVDRLLAEPRTPAVLARRQAFAARHSWARRADDVYQAIAGLR